MYFYTTTILYFYEYLQQIPFFLHLFPTNIPIIYEYDPLFYSFIEYDNTVTKDIVQDPLTGLGAGFGSALADIFLTESLRSPFHSGRR